MSDPLSWFAAGVVWGALSFWGGQKVGDCLREAYDRWRAAKESK